MSTEPKPSCSSSVSDTEVTSTRVMENCLYCWVPLDDQNKTFYYCVNCSSYTLCTTCYLVSDHEHILRKCGQHFVTSDENEDNEIYDGMEGTVVFSKDEFGPPITDNIRRCLQIVSHTTRCTKDPCPYTPCGRMRRVINHAAGCRRQPGQSSPCPICKNLVSLITYHAESCDYNNCGIPYCNRIKQKLTQKRLERAVATSSN